MLLYSHCSGQTDDTAPAVVLIHGLFGSYENLGVIARSLAGQFRVINVDVRNHGRSAHSDEMNYELMAEDLAQTLDALNISRAALLGHSMGGKMAMAFALKYPKRVSKLILADIAPVGYPPRHNTIIAGLSAVDMATVENRSDADQQLAQFIAETGVRQFLLKSLHKDDDGFSWRFNVDALQRNYTTLIGEPLTTGIFNGPTLFIKGGDSDYILPEHKARIMQLFPQAQAKIIQGTGHWLHAEKPAAFSKLVLDFLLS